MIDLATSIMKMHSTAAEKTHTHTHTAIVSIGEAPMNFVYACVRCVR